MVYTKTYSTFLGTASKTITLDLSVWANLTEVCNAKKWNLAKCITVLASNEAEVIRDLAQYKKQKLLEYGKNPNNVPKPQILKK